MGSNKYAARTDVSISQSRDELERILVRFGATAYGYMSQNDGLVIVSFELKGFRIAMKMQQPSLEQFRFTEKGKARSDSAASREWEQECKRRWRSLTNGVKAKLALIDDDISSVEREFLADLLVPGTGMTYGEQALPEIVERYERKGELPAMTIRIDGP